MYKQLASFISIALLSAISFTGNASDDVDIHLSQQVQTQCDGQARQEVIALPGDCIIYQLIVQNNSQLPIHDVEIETLIPASTKLWHPLINTKTGQHANTQIITRDAGAEALKTTLDFLPAGSQNRTILEYSVRIID